MTEALEFAAVTAERWPDLARLFEARGGPSYCWCMLWRAMPGSERGKPGGKRAALQQRVRDGVPVGLLAYADGEPVAWCSVAPRETYRKLGGGEYPAGTNVWASSASSPSAICAGEELAHGCWRRRAQRRRQTART